MNQMTTRPEQSRAPRTPDEFLLSTPDSIRKIQMGMLFGPAESTKPLPPGAGQVDAWLAEATTSWQLEMIEERLERLEQRGASVRAAITTLAPAPYALRRPIEAVLEPDGSGFVASFYEANITASGDNPTDAYTNLKDLVVGMWEMLREAPAEELGPEPMQQMAVLSEFIAR